MSQPGGSVFFTGADTMNTGRIFSGRLTYDKGGAIVHSLRFLTNNDSLWFQTLRGFQNLYKDGNASAIDFQNYYQTQTGINPTQFFNQWYYGEGYPTFDIRYNFANGQFFLKSTQSVSMPGVTPLFITPVEYRITRTAMQDTIIRVMHSQAIENYTLPLIGNVTSVQCDPKNWLINKVLASVRDLTLGISPNPDGFEENAGAFTQLQIGPNPCKSVLKIENPGQVKGRYALFDGNGKAVLEGELSLVSELNLLHLASGVYILSIRDMNGEEKGHHKIIRP